MQTNPVREAIVNLQESNQDSLSILVEEMVSLERFQPNDPNINIRKVSSFEYFVKKLYKPKENIESVYQLTALALIMSADRRVTKQLIESQYFETPLISDIKYVLEKVQRIDPDYLRIVLRFMKFTMASRHCSDQVKQVRYQLASLVAQKAIDNVDSLKLEDLAYISDICRYHGQS